MTQTVLPPRIEIVPSLREYCDRCTAAAKLHVTLQKGGDLVFCGHHANRHTDDIVSHATHILIEIGFDWRGTAMIAAQAG